MLFWTVFVFAAFAVLVCGSRAWVVLRAWRQSAAAFGSPAPLDRPVREDAQALADELAGAGFQPGEWRWLAAVEWACLALQRVDGTRALILSGDRPPGFDIVSEVVSGPALVTEHSAFSPATTSVVRQALGPLPPAALLAAHDRALDAADRPALVGLPAADLTASALAFERRALEEILAKGWSNAFDSAFRQMFNRQVDTVPVADRLADVERLRSTAPR